MIAIWGEGSAGSRYKSIIEDLGFEVILLKRNKEKEPFNFKNLDKSKIDAAVICTPTIFHSEQSIKFLEVGIPVLCEKPIAHTYNEGLSIIKTALSMNTKFHVGYNQRFLPAYELFKEKKWGNPLVSKSVWAEKVSEWQPENDYKESYAVRKELGGGVPLTLSHDFDWWTGLFGDFEVLDVNSSNNGTLNISIDTNFDVTLEGEIKCFINLNYEIDGPPVRYYETEYEKGILRYEPLIGSLKFFWNNGEVDPYSIEQEWSKTRIETFKNTFLNFMDDTRSPSELTEWELGLSALKLASIVDNWNE